MLAFIQILSPECKFQDLKKSIRYPIKMARFKTSVKQSGYLKFMLTVYVFTLFLLGSQLLTMSELNSLLFLSNESFNFNVKGLKNYDNKSPSKSLFKAEVRSGEVKVQSRIVSDCRHTAFPKEHYRSQTWQKVGPSNETLVFSAYHDERSGGLLMMTGLSNKNPHSIFCQLWYKQDGTPDIVMQTSTAKIEKLHSSPFKYTSSYIKCSLPGKLRPFAVSLVHDSRCLQADNAIEIKYLQKQNYTRKFTVCLCPLNFRYGRAYELVEWIELNLILGADHFVVYNYSSAVNVVSVLDHYARLGIVDVIQWPLPIGVDKWPHTSDPVHVHYFAQTASLNDCLLRNRGESEYIVNLDLDEFIIPHSKNAFSWSDMIGRLKPSGGYMVRSTFFRKEWTNEKFDFPEKQEAEKYRLVTLLKTEREASIFPTKQRSKYFAKTSAAELIVTHEISRMAPGQTISNVPSEVGLVHHYRNWLKYDDKQQRVKDDIVIEKYAKVLVERVAKRWSMLENVTMGIPIE